MKKNLILLLSFLTILACKIPEPKVSRVEWQVNWLYNPQDQSVANFLTVFASLDGVDPARTAPIAKVSRKDLGLSWSLIDSFEDEEEWVASYAAGHITMEGGLSVGNYILSVEDMRGPISEQILRINQIDQPPIDAFPIMQDQRLDTRFDRAILMVYRNNQFFLMSHIYSDLYLPEKRLGESFYLYRFSPKLGVGLLSGPY